MKHHVDSSVVLLVAEYLAKGPVVLLLMFDSWFAKAPSDQRLVVLWELLFPWQDKPGECNDYNEDN